MNKTFFNKFSQIAFIVLLGLMTFMTSCKEEGEKNDTSNEDPMNWNSMKLSPTMTATLENGILTITTSKDSEAMPDYNMKFPPWDNVRYNIISVVIEKPVSSIGENAFYGCTSLSSVTIPNSVTSIGPSAFSGCEKLNLITIPNSVTHIGDAAFSACEKLTSITIPNLVSFIGEYAFYGCTSLTAINVDIGNPAFSSDAGVFYNKNKTTIILYPQMKNNTTFVIPGTVITIEKYAFLDCKKLTSITIPNSVKSIGELSLGYCEKLSTLIIPASVEKIETYAFSNCTGLQDVNVSWTTPLTVPTFIFPYINTSAIKLHVPTGTKARYQAANVWKDFGTIVEK